MNPFEDNLWDTVLDEHGEDLAQLPASPARPSRRGRNGVMAGGTLALAALGAGLVLAFSGSTAPPAFAITHSADGSLLVHLKNVEAVPAAERELAAMGVDEWFSPSLSAGTATGDGVVTCTIPTAAQAGSVSNATHRSSSGVAPGGPVVKVLLGTNGSEMLPAGQATLSQPNGGPMHIDSCYLYSGPFPGTGNTGAGNTGG